MAYLTLRRRPARQGTVGQRATYGPGLIEGGGDVLLADSSQLVRQVTVVKRLPRVAQRIVPRPAHRGQHLGPAPQHLELEQILNLMSGSGAQARLDPTTGAGGGGPAASSPK